MAGSPTLIRQQAAPVQSGALVSPVVVRLGRLALWLIVATASAKPIEIFGPGEQYYAPPPAADFVFRCLVLVGCLFAAGVALLSGRVRRESILFLGFLAWAILVGVALQSDFSSLKQLGSYASWILFYIAASALLDQPGDFRTLAFVTVLSVFVSAAGGEMQHLLGYGPALGTKWPDLDSLEFMRTHTGSGGILLDTFTPDCAALLLLSLPEASLSTQCGAWVLVLWGTANILRGGLLAFACGLCWFLWAASAKTRRRILPVMVGSIVVGTLLFSATVMAKMNGSQTDGVNTSGRLDEWPQLIEWIQEEPILGHGPDADMQLLDESTAGRDLRASHNELLSTGVNYGVIGIFLLWAPLSWLLIRAMMQAGDADGETKEQFAAASSILLMIVILSFTDNTLRSPGIMIVALGPIAVSRGGWRALQSSMARRNTRAHPGRGHTDRVPDH
jgi:hypothetical protein